MVSFEEHKLERRAQIKNASKTSKQERAMDMEARMRKPVYPKKIWE